MKIKSFKSILILFPILLHCASANKSAFKNITTYNGNSNRAIESKVKIDNWKTFEIFFIPGNTENCISVNISSEVFDEVLNKNAAAKTYFIIEKAIDISKFNADNRNIFSEMGRNFDYNWNNKEQINICSSRTDPIKTIDKNNIFRIRFTIFRDINFKYTVDIQSESPVKISEKIQ